MAKAQERQQAQANKHRRPVDFTVKDKVWVSTRNWTSERPSKKLGYQNEGPVLPLRGMPQSGRTRAVRKAVRLEW